MIIKLKTLFRGHVLLVILTEKKLSEHSMEKNCKKRNKSLKSNKRKDDKLYLK